MVDIMGGAFKTVRGFAQLQQGEQQLELERRKMALEQGRQDTAERTVGVQEGQLELAKNTEEAQYYRSLAGAPVRMKTMLTSLSNKVPEAAPLLKPFTERLVDGDLKTRKDAISELMALRYTPQFKTMRRALVNGAAKAVEKGDVVKAEQLEAMYNDTSDDNYERMVDTLTRKPQSLWRTAQQMGAGRGGTPKQMGQKVWDDRTQSWIQRDVNTGEWEKVVQAGTRSAGRRIYDKEGNLIFEEGVDLKTVPVGVVDKLSALKASAANLDRMSEILKKNPNVDISGMWEVVNVYIDNWNIAGRQDRNRGEFRQRVALSLDFMYNIMGRQLAVQEMRKGAPMLPEMKVDEKINMDRIRNLIGYMKAMSRAKRDTLSQYGYKVPEGPIDPTNQGVQMAIRARTAVIVDELQARGVTDPAEITRLATAQVQQEFFGE